jgi:hypothetical protein
MINYNCHSTSKGGPVAKNTVIYDGVNNRIAAFEQSKIDLHKPTTVSGNLSASSLAVGNMSIDSSSIKLTNSTNYT